MHSSTVAVLLLAVAAGQSAVAAPIEWTKVQARDTELDVRTHNPRALLAMDERGLFSGFKDVFEKAAGDVGHLLRRDDADDNDNGNDDDDDDEQGQAS
ncbi:hypothetical protein FA95DRAFT_1614211, partial [Auriscalpium vulgare]